MSEETKWTKLRNFVKDNEATLTARYYSQCWHIAVIWDHRSEGYQEGISPSFSAAVELVWNKVEAITNTR